MQWKGEKLHDERIRFCFSARTEERDVYISLLGTRNLLI